jgi:hypothetical protein
LYQQCITNLVSASTPDFAHALGATKAEPLLVYVVDMLRKTAPEANQPTPCIIVTVHMPVKVDWREKTFT